MYRQWLLDDICCTWNLLRNKLTDSVHLYNIPNESNKIDFDINILIGDCMYVAVVKGEKYIVFDEVSDLVTPLSNAGPQAQ